MIKVSRQDIDQIFDHLIQGKESREQVALWASRRMFANDREELEFVPTKDRALIWRAIKYLTGVDLRDLDGSYFHSIENFIDYKEDLEE